MRDEGAAYVEVAELEAEAARLNAQQQQPSNQRGEALLAQSTFDARALHRQILELEQRAEFAQHRVEADGRDLDAALLARTDEVVVACIEGAVADAVEDGEKAAFITFAIICVLAWSLMAWWYTTGVDTTDKQVHRHLRFR